MRKDRELQRRSTTGRAERLPTQRRSSLLSPFFENFVEPLDWFDEFFNRPTLSPLTSTMPSTLLPEIDIDETEKEYVIYADMPGVSKSDINVDCSGNQVTISAERRWDRKGRRREEQGYQTYRRSFTLPSGVESDKIEAEYEDGVLKLIVPKGESLKARKIEIRSGRKEGASKETEKSPEETH